MITNTILLCTKLDLNKKDMSSSFNKYFYLADNYELNKTLVILYVYITIPAATVEATYY